ncbi:hypothetical protein [Mycobacterium sp.]|uniref:hypothetical protein n=1 Tax=Mycobacterium sp. TaxID=1785 RepID=UPI003D0DB1F1
MLIAPKGLLDDVDNRRQRGRDEIRSAAIWLTSGNYETADRIRQLVPDRAAIDEPVGSSWASGRRLTT